MARLLIIFVWILKEVSASYQLSWKLKIKCTPSQHLELRIRSTTFAHRNILSRLICSYSSLPMEIIIDTWIWLLKGGQGINAWRGYWLFKDTSTPSAGKGHLCYLSVTLLITCNRVRFYDFLDNWVIPFCHEQMVQCSHEHIRAKWNFKIKEDNQDKLLTSTNW